MNLTNEELNELFASDPCPQEFTPEELDAYFADHAPLFSDEVFE